jgi:CheY-like chemotaxis protein
VLSYQGSDLLLAGVRILAVNDEPDIVGFFEVALDRYGAEVRTSLSASGALKILNEWQPDILLCDLSMPGETGFELISKMRNLSIEKRDVPAIAISGLPSAIAKSKALSMGFSVFVSKPVEPDDLAKLIAQLISKS